MPGAGNPIAGPLRAGGRALLLLADSVSVSILHLLASGPMDSSALVDRIENVSRSTCFRRLQELEELRLIARERRAGTPPIADCQLTPTGLRLLPVAVLLERWLRRAPGGPLELGDAIATAAIKALTLGWGSTLLRWIAEQPLSLTELDPLVGDLVYRELERVMHTLVDVGLAERVPPKQRRHPYTVTLWARESVAPLAAAVRWERQEMADLGAPVTAIDAEGGLLLALPLIEVPIALQGACVLLVDAEAPSGESLGGIAVEVADGRLVSAAPVVDSDPGEHAWARGPVAAWLDAVIEGRPEALRLGRDSALAEALLTALHEALFGPPDPPAGQLSDLS